LKILVSAVRFRPRPPSFFLSTFDHAMDTKQVNQCVDALCQCGCDAVRATIKAMEIGAELPQLQTLDSESRKLVLDELKAVMAVYDDRK
jgi:hypothetical protein